MMRGLKRGGQPTPAHVCVEGTSPMMRGLKAAIAGVGVVAEQG
jgi:hypothetical protein